MCKDKISIIVPAYNLQDHIEKTVKSICEQSYNNLEIIIVDDGSKDKTLEIIERLASKDSRIMVIHQSNGGVTSARFRGIEAATGEWIGFVDGDDYIEPEMYEVLLGNAKQYGADISHCGYQMVFPSHVDYYYGTGKFIEQDNYTGIKNLLEGAFVEPGLWNKLFHRRLFTTILASKLIDTTIKINEDLLMNFYLFGESKKSVFIDQCFYHYILRKGSAATSRLNENKLCDPLKVLKIIQKELQDKPEFLGTVEKRIITQLIRLCTTFSKEQKELITPYRKNAYKELKAMLPQIVKGSYGKKQKIMALWVASCPISYYWIHKLYEKISGIEKKYEVS